MLRLIGLLFSLTVAGLLAWMGWEWSGVYIEYIRGVEDYRPVLYLGDTAYRVVLSVIGTALGFTLASLVYRQTIELAGDFVTDLRRVPARDKVAAIIGVVIGLGVTSLLGSMLLNIRPYGPPLVAIIGIASIYLGVVIMLSMKEEMSFFFAQGDQAQETGSSQSSAQPKLLDTNVIIDGRIADIATAGFIEGPILLPDFVLEELHLIADSSDSLRRNRGRRGLDILNAMQQEPDLNIRVFDDYEKSFRSGDPVDAKLVQLARQISAAIITNDFNLNKVAQLQGVKVLNVNELANAVKPVVLPGEEMTVSIVREGKEPDQGVAYLDDGTMVVVERGKPRIGESVSIVVTSVLQTVAGKMIFGQPQDDSRDRQEHSDRRNRSSSGSGARRKA